MKPEIRKARRRIFNNLKRYGVDWDAKLQKLAPLDRDGLRKMQFELAQTTNLAGRRYSEFAKDYLAEPHEIEISKITPYVVEVGDSWTSKLWSHAITNWSVPVSAGYGRRLRFLVLDRQNQKLIGIVGLCDPLIGSTIRDNHIGWDREAKLARLYNCLTAYVLGAVPPYNRILGSKLVALSVMAPDVRAAFRSKYSGNKTIIAGQERLPELVYVDTYGAFEKSAIYTKLLNWKFVSYTQGKSHIHLTANGSWETIREFVPPEKFKLYKYGNGSNWKIRTLRIGLENLGFSEDLLSIGWKRAYYGCPLARNWKEFLTGEDSKPKPIRYSMQDLVNHWRTRWVEPRQDRLVTLLNG